MTFFTLFPLTVLIVYSKEKFLIDRIPLRKRLNFDPEVETADGETTEREVAEIKLLHLLPSSNWLKKVRK